MNAEFDYEAVIGRILTMKERWGSEGRLAEQLGISPNTWTAYKKGTSSFALTDIARICDVLGVTSQWLLYGEEGLQMQRQMQFQGGNFQMVARFDVQASAGAGALVPSEDVSEHFAVGRDWLRRNLPGWAPANATVGVLDGAGDSMEPTIRDGDTLMVVRDVEWRIVERGGIFVFSLDDRLLLKRLQVMDNGDLRVISDNKAYEPFTVPFSDISDRVLIHGQVFFVGGKPRSF